MWVVCEEKKNEVERRQTHPPLKAETAVWEQCSLGLSGRRLIAVRETGETGIYIHVYMNSSQEVTVVCESVCVCVCLCVV